jgi:phage terminase large subunit-like protein
MHLEVSTAGLDPNCYGKRQYDYGKQVEAGLREDMRYFFACWESPQTLSDDELAEDPLKFGRMANPAWNHTVHTEEFLDDYNRSQQSVGELANFKTYRLNIWQLTSNPWLRQRDWTRCAGEYTEADLLGRTCFGGLDLALRWDMSAFVLIFPMDFRDEQPTFRLWPYFFLPQQSAKKSAGKVPWFDWHKSGEIQLTDGDTTDFPLIRRVINDCRKKFDLINVAYDDRFAESFAMDLKDGDGIEMLDFNQTPQNFAEPMGLFEKDVIDARIEHPNNRCLNWQAGNATKNKRGMLAKPEDDEIKKIDGMTAAVMARNSAIQPAQQWFYSNNALEIG